MIRRLAALLALAAPLTLATPASADALRPFKPPKTGALAPTDAAVAIGIARYTDLAHVPFADRDARLFHQLLLNTIGVPPGRISNLHSHPASRENIERAVRRQAKKATGTLWIYFAGHGASTRDGDAMLIGRDATADNLRPRGVRRSELIKWAETSKAKRIVVVLDACFSGKDRAGEPLTGERFAAAASVLAAPRVVVWSGTTGAQTAWPLATMRHGLFTWFVVGALSGWAADDAGQVTLGRAARWVTQAMDTAQSVLHRDQTPVAVGPKGWDAWPVARRGAKAPPAPDLGAWSLSGARVKRPSGGVQVVTGGGQDIAALAAQAAAAEAAQAQAAAQALAAKKALAAERERQLSAAIQRVQADAAREFQAIRDFVERPRPAGRAVLQAWLKKYEGAKVAFGGMERAVPVANLAAVSRVLALMATPMRPSLVLIRRGNFMMGSPPNELHRDRDELQHKVEVSGFEMMTTEVTQGQYGALLGKRPSYFSECGKHCPVEQVSWLDTVMYANALSKTEALSTCYDIDGESVQWKSGCDGYRLPTEAEWEYAARAGTTAARYGSIGDTFQLEQYNKNPDETYPVGAKTANAWGLYDMLDNVFDWCWDHRGDYATSIQRDPRGPTEGVGRVIRGGFGSDAHAMRLADRLIASASVRSERIGIRLVRRPRAH